ncbi:solute carrier family 28 member 3-like [Neocloeon triangulifer]|uniref:solute carrier family 28 member 3-like n=1 Tax=Neocloeon triangulifer TaxID=2078957 RepID=UPI00286F8B58|nr:solute carrier family 28 member 3-like [Neocloeon triangulifer]XP_059489888.1 solute carrier family 28 member 3-like [Neocloeon triangulifer]XP_059489889.1 solute carrier family 28 member 3-like [Neocloeon triangulifer]XP_059489890.1 solute carrier family 28 member 3-like [Neocloeon triangulifer]XP_059489891.1 solute carrier family 28 member 3-like [Neocloeon triangulifer]XP_059489892.1 solute carrier family 28 member 3-like [Neocloeon triangulifer]XP_059489893.1 solute carrier family 28 m
MDGKENPAFDIETPPLEPVFTIEDSKGEYLNGNNFNNGGQLNQLDESAQQKPKKKIKIPKSVVDTWTRVRRVLTNKRVAHMLIVLYFTGALIYWFAINTSARQWIICQDEGLLLVLLFFYLIYVICYFGHYVGKISMLIRPIYRLSIKTIGPLMTKILIYGLQVGALTAYLIWDIWDDFSRWRSIIGVFKNLFVLWLFSSYKRKIKIEVPLRSLLLQFYICLIMLRIPFVNDFITCITSKFTAFLNFSKGGGSMVFGEELANSVFAFLVMPVILFLSFVVAILNHLNILPRFISSLGRALLWVLGTQSEVEAFTSASSIFLGQTESPILIQHYLPKMTRSEIFTVMVSGLSTIAGSVMAAYIQFGISAVHMITASIMSSIGAIGLCKLFMPDTEPSETKEMELKKDNKEKVNVFDITSSSASNAFEIIKSIVACLIIWLSVIPFANSVIETFFYLLTGISGVTFEYLLGLLFTPFAYLMGADWADSQKVGKLVGIKIVINEFVAYTELKDLEGIISERSMTVATYALCGFSNFGALATLVSTLKVMAPSKTKDFTKNAYWALLVANVVCDMTACIAGALTP